MTNDSTPACGIDIGKANLDVALYPSGETLRLPNDAKGHRELVVWLTARAVTRIGMEASGGYERGVLAFLRTHPFEVALLQPRQVRAFAVYRLRRAKNDRLDALLIAQCTAGLDTVREAPDPRYAPLAEHLRLIEQIESDLARARTRVEGYREENLIRLLKEDVERLKKQLKEQLQALTETITRDAGLKARLALIESVQGVGRRTGLTLLVLMPELGRLDRGQIASLAGLAPYDHESGKYQGQRRIAGGRGRVRRALYAAALPASFQWNPALMALYKRLRDKGKSHKQALVACARKLLTFVNSVLARGSEWEKSKLQSNGC